MTEDKLAIALLSMLFMALKLHATLADRDEYPYARIVHLGWRFREFVAWAELRVAVRRQLEESHRAPPMHLRTEIRNVRDDGGPYA